MFDRHRKPYQRGVMIFFIVLLASSAMAAIDLPLIQQSNPDFDWRALAKGEVVWQEVIGDWKTDGSQEPDAQEPKAKDDDGR